MHRLRKLWANWIAAIRRKPRHGPLPTPEFAAVHRLVRRRARRLDARGLQGLLDDAFAGRTPPTVEMEVPPRKAVGA